jgi:aryl-alcohol dehydrogenase-like predicted oxidoreductase
MRILGKARNTLVNVAIPVDAFGRTGHNSSRTLFGAASLARVTQDVADRTLEVLLRYGVNHLDTAASYGDAELRIRPWLKREPGRFFLATKTDERTKVKARDELHRSLERLGVDHVDLWQLHNLADPIEWDTALSPGGVIEAAVDARAEGLVRFIGVTGHGAQIAANHRRSLERFDFDSVLLPYNFVTMQLPYYAENFEALVKTCFERKVAVQTIKSIALRPWRGRQRTRATWYEPLENQGDIDLAVWWVLGRPGVFLNTVGDVDLLPLVLDAAGRFEKRPSEADVAAMLERSKTQPLFV